MWWWCYTDYSPWPRLWNASGGLGWGEEITRVLHFIGEHWTHKSGGSLEAEMLRTAFSAHLPGIHPRVPVLFLSVAIFWNSGWCLLPPLGHSGMNEEISFRKIFIPEDFSLPCALLLLKSDPGGMFWVASTAIVVMWLMENQIAGSELIRGTSWTQK